MMSPLLLHLCTCESLLPDSWWTLDESRELPRLKLRKMVAKYVEDHNYPIEVFLPVAKAASLEMRSKLITGSASLACSQPTGGDAGGLIRNCFSSGGGCKWVSSTDAKSRICERKNRAI